MSFASPHAEMRPHVREGVGLIFINSLLPNNLSFWVKLAALIPNISIFSITHPTKQKLERKFILLYIENSWVKIEYKIINQTAFN